MWLWLWLQTNGVRALVSELTSRRELRALQVGETLKGALHRSGVSLHRTQTEGKGVSLTWQTFEKSLALGVSDADDDNGVARAPSRMYVLYLYTQWELERQPGFNCACYRNCAISRLCTGAAQSRDCVKLVHNLKIV